MIDAVHSLLSLFSVCLKTRADLQAENLMLRYQLEVFRRATPKRVRITKVDRLIFVWLYRLWPASIRALRIVRPKTLVRWHREGFRVFWRWKSRPRAGRPRVGTELRALIRQMTTIGQDEQSSVIYGMNKRAKNEGAVVKELPLVEIVPNLIHFMSERLPEFS